MPTINIMSIVVMLLAQELNKKGVQQGMPSVNINIKKGMIFKLRGLSFTDCIITKIKVQKI